MDPLKEAVHSGATKYPIFGSTVQDVAVKYCCESRSFGSQNEWLAISAAQDLPSGFLLAMPVLAAEGQGNQGGVVQFRAFNAGEELKAFLFLGLFVGLFPLFVRDLSQ